jgi:hypothetical protein
MMPEIDDGSDTEGQEPLSESASLLALAPLAGGLLSGSITKAGEVYLSKLPKFSVHPLTCNTARDPGDLAQWELAVHSNVAAGAYIIDVSEIDLFTPKHIGFDTDKPAKLPFLLKPGVVTRLIAVSKRPASSKPVPSLYKVAFTVQRLDASDPLHVTVELVDVVDP